MKRMDEGMPFLLQYEHVAWYEDGKVRILDRRVYPREVRFEVCETYRQVVRAIADMVTQSAGPYTAVGMGMALAAHQARDKSRAEQLAFLRQAAQELAHARPTTANRYGQITFRCADVAEAALEAGQNPVAAIVEDTLESLGRRYSTMQLVGDHLVGLHQYPRGRNGSHPMLRGNHHRKSYPGRKANGKVLPGVLRGDPAFPPGGPAHRQLLCPGRL